MCENYLYPEDLKNSKNIIVSPNLSNNYDNWWLILYFFSPFFRREEIRGKNNQSRGQSHAFLLDFKYCYRKIGFSLLLLVKFSLLIFFALFLVITIKKQSCNIFLAPKGDSNKFSFYFSPLRLKKSDKFCHCDSWRSINYKQINAEKKPCIYVKQLYEKSSKDVNILLFRNL